MSGLGEVGKAARRSEVFVARVVGGGKVTIPLAVRELVGIEDDDYVRLRIVEVIKGKKKTLKNAGIK